MQASLQWKRLALVTKSMMKGALHCLCGFICEFAYKIADGFTFGAALAVGFHLSYLHNSRK